MSFNTDEIVQEIRSEFESMLVYVLESDDATADQVERGVFRQLLSLGAQLMVLFFSQRTAGYAHTPLVIERGAEVPFTVPVPCKNSTELVEHATSLSGIEFSDHLVHGINKPTRRVAAQLHGVEEGTGTSTPRQSSRCRNHHTRQSCMSSLSPSTQVDCVASLFEAR